MANWPVNNDDFITGEAGNDDLMGGTGNDYAVKANWASNAASWQLAA